MSLAALNASADDDIRERLERQPAAPLPARLAVARVQEPGYRWGSVRGYGDSDSRFSVVTARTVETDADIERLRGLPMTLDVAVMSRLILPPTLNSERDVRRAAALLHADILCLYTFDTDFRIDDSPLAHGALLYLGLLPDREAQIAVTASAAVYDVRTGFLYGIAETTAHEKQLASAWSSSDAVDDCRRRAERQAFAQLLGELEKTWTQIVAQRASATTATTAANPSAPPAP